MTYQEMCAFDVLYAAYLEARKGKRKKVSTAQYEANALACTEKLSRILAAKIYIPGKFETFYVFEPKKRLVQAPAFVDKVVLHAVTDNILYEAVTKGFIRDNYASQKGKGTHAGLMRLKQLMVDYKLTQDELAERIGKSRPAIANTLRLLNLCPEVISLVSEGKLSAGHARTIVPLPAEEQVNFAHDAIRSQYSVRELEKKVRAYNIPPEILDERKKKKRALASIELKQLVERMRFAFRTKVSLIGTDKKGRIYIDYYSRDDLDRIAEILDIIDKQ